MSSRQAAALGRGRSLLSTMVSLLTVSSLTLPHSHGLRMRDFFLILQFRRIHDFLRILKMLMNFNKIRYREKLQIGRKSFMQTY